jgi:hypothetical protein
MIVAIIGEFVIPRAYVPGDPAATARNITGGQLVYRLDILTSFSTLVLFIVLVALLYKLLRDVDDVHAMTMVLLVTVGIAVSFAGMLFKFVPLVLLGGTEYAAAFPKPQIDALSFAALRVHGSGSALATGFWGLWLFPFGALVFRSWFLPRVLGVLLWIAGVGYVVTSIVSIALPHHRQLVSSAMMPLYLGELPIIFWLLLGRVGERDRAVAAPAA